MISTKQPPRNRELDGVHRSGSRLIGREFELRQLAAGLRDACQGRGRCFLIVGDPGIGKTSLADAAAEVAGDLGMQVALGRCWEGGGAPSFWPWTQILRACAADRAAAALQLGPARSLLGIAERVGGAVGGADPTRFALFDSVVQFLKVSSRETAHLLLIDDLHAADEDSLLLMQFVCRELRALSICLVATCRDVEARAGSRFAERVAALGRDLFLMKLGGLGEEDVAALVHETLAEVRSNFLPDSITPDFSATLCRATDGNPFFVREVIRGLAAETDGRILRRVRDGDISLPDHVREAVRARIRPLSSETARFLSAASILGREFDSRIASHIAGLQGRDALLPILDEATLGGALTVTPAHTLRYAFSHALVRETLYDDCPAGQRAQLHAAAAAAMEGLYQPDVEAHAEEIVHHLFLAGAAAEPQRVIHYTASAAARASSVFAYDDAVHYWERGLQFAEILPQAANVKSLLGEMLVGLGSSLNHAGQREQARGVLERAMDAARVAGDAELFARAVLAYGGESIGSVEVAKVNSGPGAVFDDHLGRLLREALARLGERKTALVARLLSRLAVEMYFMSTWAERKELTDRALAIVRGLDDPAALAHVLCETHVAIMSPDNIDVRIAMCREAVCLGHETGQLLPESAARSFILFNLLELGDVDALAAEAAAVIHVAEETRLPYLLWEATKHKGMRALLAGEYEQAEALFQQGLEHGRGDNAMLAFTVQLMSLRREQGRLHELSDSIGLFKAVADQYPKMLYIRATLAYLYAELGNLEEARLQVELAAADDFESLARDVTWLAAVTRLAEACWVLADRRHAAALFRLLEAFARFNSVGTLGGVCWGSVARDLGNLAALQEHWQESERFYELALQRNAALGARTWVAHTQYNYAVMLQRRAQQELQEAPALLARAYSLATNAQAVVASCGMKLLQDRVDALLPELGTPPPLSAQTAGDVAVMPMAEGRQAVAAPLFSREGEYWTISYLQKTFRLKHTAGIGHVSHLVRHAGRELAATELLQADADVPAARQGIAELPGLTFGPGADAGEMLDATARQQYKRRLDELRADLAEASGANDLLRAEQLEQEIDFLMAELARAVGLGGRSRRAGSHTERARVNVTRAITSALKRVAEHHPELGRHLAASIRTGTFCSYLGPHNRVRWTA